MRPAASRRRLRLGAVAALLAAAGLWWSVGRAAGDRSAAWTEVRRGDLVVGVDVRGTLAAVDPVGLGPPSIPDQWSLKIAYMAPEGQAVRQGMPVLRLDPSELDRHLGDRLAEQEQAAQQLAKKRIDVEMKLEDARLELAEARAKERKAALKVDVPPELVAAVDLAQWHADLTLARREVAYQTSQLALARRQGEAEVDDLTAKRARAAARVGELRSQIASLTVRTPRAGIVVYLAGRGGEKKKVGDNAYQGETVIEIPDLRRLRADAEIDEADLSRVAVGQPVVLRLDAHPDEPVSGRVEAVRGAVTTRSDANLRRVVEVELALDRADPLRMRPGMRFQGSIEVDRVRGALVAPADAVAATAEGPAVVRATAFGTEVVHPRLGKRNERMVQILSGLAVGDRVARPPSAAGPEDGRAGR